MFKNLKLISKSIKFEKYKDSGVIKAIYHKNYEGGSFECGTLYYIHQIPEGFVVTAINDKPLRFFKTLEEAKKFYEY